MRLKGRNIIVGVCGGIAAYKIPSFIRLLVKHGAEVQSVVTANGSRFVGEAALSTITKRPVISSLFPANHTITTEHISSSEWADALVIAPATANCIGKCANGIADDFLSTLYLSLNVPVVFAPAMNTVMWDHPAVKANVAVLKKRGHTIIEPDSGMLACGTSGKGRMPSEDVLLYETLRAIYPKPLKGKKILVTAGGTEEPIDPVRVISNRSSGKMGIAIALEAWLRGADVTLVCASVSAPIPSVLQTVNVRSVEELKKAVHNYFPASNALVMAAAVSDFSPVRISSEKIKKNGRTSSIGLKETVDILKSVSQKKGRGQKIIGFALEDTNAVERAREKMKTKKCDMLVLNSPAALGSDITEITIMKPRETSSSVRASKEEAAALILDNLALL